MANSKKSVHNSVRCLKCNDVIVSTHQHDFRYCKCKHVFVDGGPAYKRRGWTGEPSWMEIDENGNETPPKVGA